MKPETVQEYLDAEPFRPFQVEHRDGRRWDVTRRSDAQAFKARLIVLVDHDPETEIADSAKMFGWGELRTVRHLEGRVAA